MGTRHPDTAVIALFSIHTDQTIDRVPASLPVQARLDGQARDIEQAAHTMGGLSIILL
jgi:hypothetical protein